MKYFTSEWWASSCGNRVPFEEYQAAFNSIRDALPQAVVQLEELHTLHDARVEGVACDFTERRISLALAGWSQDLSHPVRYLINFLEVSLFEQALPSGRSVESELGDLGYWEYELCDRGVEMRMLFASSAEFRVVFNDLSFSATAAAA